MAQITLTIPDNKLQKVLDAFEEKYPIPIDENDAPLYTQSAWAKEQIRQFIIKTVLKREQRIARASFVDAVADDDVVT